MGNLTSLIWLAWLQMIVSPHCLMILTGSEPWPSLTILTGWESLTSQTTRLVPEAVTMRLWVSITN